VDVEVPVVVPDYNFNVPGFTVIRRPVGDSGKIVASAGMEERKVGGWKRKAVRAKVGVAWMEVKGNVKKWYVEKYGWWFRCGSDVVVSDMKANDGLGIL
jgi:hypothetical protein